jgi:hypothetical protein
LRSRHRYRRWNRSRSTSRTFSTSRFSSLDGIYRESQDFQWCRASFTYRKFVNN